MPIVVITGAGAGVGRATAEEFARHSYDVGLLSRERPVWSMPPTRSLSDTARKPCPFRGSVPGRRLAGNLPQALFHLALANTVLGLSGPTLKRSDG